MTSMENYEEKFLRKLFFYLIIIVFFFLIKYNNLILNFIFKLVVNINFNFNH